MTFLNPTFLWASLAVLVPIIIHFFNFRRPKKVLFSNTSLVKEVQKTVVKKIKLQQWILLLTRILAILSLVFLFARPIILDKNDSKLLGGNSVVVVIDNSYSMKAGNEKGAYFLQARKVCSEIFKSFSKQDEYLFMTTDDLKIHYQFGTQEEVLKELKNIKINQNTTTIGDILGMSKEVFSKAGKPNQQLYFISDFQESTVLSDSLLSERGDSSISITCIPLCTREQKNVYIERHEITSNILNVGQPINMQMRLVNDGKETVKDLGIRIMVEGKAIGISSESLGPGEIKEKVVTFTPTTSGWLNGKVVIDDYPIEYDNQRFFSLYIPDKEKILFVEGDYSPQLRVFFDSLLTQFETHRISYKKISSVDLNEYKFVVFGGIDDISTGLQEKLRIYSEQGNSILFFPGDNLDIANVNQFFSSMNIGTFGEMKVSPEGVEAPVADLSHPLFESVYKKGKAAAKFDGPTLFRHYPFSPNSVQVHNNIISMKDGSPLLLEAQPGSALVYIFTTFPDDAFTDLHYKALFPSLLQRLVMMMNQTRSQQQTHVLGSGGYKQVKTREKDLIHLKSGEKIDLIPEQYLKGGFVVLKFGEGAEDGPRISEGNYELIQKDQLLEKISFNVPDSESRLGCQNIDGLKQKFSILNLTNIGITPGIPENISHDLKVKNEGIQLWRLFLYLAIAFLLIEVLILYFKK